LQFRGGMKLAALLLLVAACGSPAPSDDSAAPDGHAEPVTRLASCSGVNIAATITTVGFAYSPTAVTVNVGDVVEIHPGTDHDAVATDGSFSVGFGVDACLQMNEAAVHDFFCEPHRFHGTITVQ
jgi:plastocyanin